ncbi:MAG: N-acetylmuramoyl-L-alanine amidase [Clostridia bacterium]|nr:N-acetylmuramoyl-L-alanine amidase [Clostridia bacterium]
MRRYFSIIFATICFCITACFTALRSIVYERENSIFASSERVFTVVIDAGHGGMDGGVVGKRTGIKESDLNLGVSFALKDVFEDAGFFVVLTRKTQLGLSDDVGLWNKNADMRKRREIIKNANPDLVLSIHQNSLPSSTRVRGGQVFYKTDSLVGEKLAVLVQDAINFVYSKHGVKDRVAKAEEYYMLECTNAPSLIVECGFLSNAEDEYLLTTNTHKKQLANAIFSGVMAFFSQS